jgi:hypothetical protein
MRTVPLAIAAALTACTSGLDHTDRLQLTETANEVATLVDIYAAIVKLDDQPTGPLVTGTRAAFEVHAEYRAEETGGSLAITGSGAMVGVDLELTLALHLERWPGVRGIVFDDVEEVTFDGDLALVETARFDSPSDLWPDSLAKRVGGELTATGRFDGTYDIALDICRRDWWPLMFFGDTMWGYVATVDGEPIRNSFVGNTATCEPE